MGDIGVRFVEKRDVAELSQVLARAFFDDPVMVWMIPDETRRVRALERMFGAMTRHHFVGGGGAEVAADAGGAGRIGAASLWDPPGRWKQTPREELRMMPSLIRALGRHARRGMTMGEVMKKHHPEEPHWYLGVIGSDPDVRGKGFGNALMRSRLDRCDAEGAPAYLESSKESNVPYYMRFGFEVTAELTVPDGGPTMWQMWRNPG
ncbi:GNAT family N-acetyltransferase [Mycolicibacterium parafortuitum]|uniref:Puromycin N-acetyltransferase [Rhodococcus jostii RHA1] n=1 Tax=Mycolicibacterium parafortuitum TaxID=39692 RepID=A0A375YPB7_MYCPF|nr:GNAT family N-acetyltransferase [Mycolicibacterium parafortuitum]ORB28463.1 GNAT family N-acetyltransferase [Mycolicibacterium parafortuitum]SRX82976.1 puromycin N-acetyltransferase [Rhodococcus jostii RHA1] [Mycolicibacterium parafortuitum]